MSWPSRRDGWAYCRWPSVCRSTWPSNGRRIPTGHCRARQPRRRSPRSTFATSSRASARSPPTSACRAEAATCASQGGRELPRTSRGVPSAAGAPVAGDHPKAGRRSGTARGLFRAVELRPRVPLTDGHDAGPLPGGVAGALRLHWCAPQAKAFFECPHLGNRGTAAKRSDLFRSYSRPRPTASLKGFGRRSVSDSKIPIRPS